MTSDGVRPSPAIPVLDLGPTRYRIVADGPLFSGPVAEFAVCAGTVVESTLAELVGATTDRLLPHLASIDCKVELLTRPDEPKRCNNARTRAKMARLGAMEA